MHLSVRHSQSLEAADTPVNPDQSPADMLMLSFTDSDLACMAEAYKLASGFPSLRVKSLAPLKHPLSVDLYLEEVAAHAKVIVVRLLGGYEWWRYGAEELGRLAREKNTALVMVPGDHHPDARLTALSTAPLETIAAIDACLAQGGIDNAQRVLHCMAGIATQTATALPVPSILPNGALYAEAHAEKNFGNALILFYRAHYLAADLAPIDALLASLAAQGLSAHAFMVSSLRDPASLAALRDHLATRRPDIILDATAFSAGQGGDAHPLADIGVPILQCALANISRESWQESPRGLGATDLAMHVVLPEADGRIFTRAISFKAQSAVHTDTEFTRMIHQPEPDRIEYIAALSAAWVKLAKTKPAERRLALLLSDYPDRAGRIAYAVGLDGPQSAAHILQLLKDAGYSVILSAAKDLPTPAEILRCAQDDTTECYSLTAYRARFAALPLENQQALIAAWGEPESDAFFRDGAFHLPCAIYGNVTVALQPDRGSSLDRKSGYHDASTPPRHGYLAFYWWLRDSGIDALVHLGTHGNLEWLPGKSVALSSQCWPEIALGATPVIYPYIVSDPGEAAQAKRRISAVTLSHLTPPLMPVSLTPELAELETLVDEYGSADGLDSRRMKLLCDEIIHRARRAGLPGAEADEASLMSALETHLCDIKEQRVGDGLHIFGQSPQAERRDTMADALYETAGGRIEKTAIAERLAACGTQETKQLLAALNGRFIPPGAGGSPVRGRLDLMPTGHNLVTIDPRMIPMPTAAAIGKRAAEEFVRRYTQDHGDWPRRIVIDVWGSATLRNGGDEIAQALWLMGVQPVWDSASHRVSGFDILAPDAMNWPRIDVSLRISGLFRDMFAHVITLFDDAVQAVAALDEPADINPIAAATRGLDANALRQATWRVFGNAPGAYGAGVTGLIDNGRWAERAELGAAYLQASQYAYGRDADGQAEPGALKERIGAADALVHVQDIRESDVLSGADFADAEGGFAAAAQMLGNDPALYHLDSSQPGAIKARTLAEEISLTLQARALQPAWIAGQMCHGYAGAAALADVTDQLFAFAATTDAVASAQFEAVFNAYIFDETVRDFLTRDNPQALQAIANRLDEAIRRGMWNPLRNSAWILLDTLRGKNAEAA